MESSFRGTVLYAPLPGYGRELDDEREPAMQAQLPGDDAKKAERSASNQLYKAYLKEQQKVTSYLVVRPSFAEWARTYTVVKTTIGDKVQYVVKRRGGHGVGKNKEKVAVAIRFPWELLDNYIGAWCATMVPHVREHEFAPWLKDEETKRRYEDDVPKLARYLQAAMEHPYYNDDVQKLLDGIKTHLERRGKTHNEIVTVCRRIEGWKMVLDNTGDKGLRLPAQI